MMKINFIGIKTILSREAQRAFRVSIQSIVAPLISAILYITIFGQIVGSKISFVSGKYSYLEFVLPGILTLNLMTSSFSQAAFSLYYQKFTRHIQETLVAPLSNFDIILGYLLGSLFRSLVVCAGIYAIAIGFKVASISHFWQFLTYIIMISMLFSFLGMITALWAESWEQASIFEIFIITPLTFLGGMFTSFDMISLKYQSLMKLNPFFYFIDGIRYSMIGTQESNPLTRFILVFFLLFLSGAWAYRLFAKGYKIRP